MHSVLRALVASIAALALVPAAAAAQTQVGEGPNAYTVTEHYIETSDPLIKLHADVMRPANIPADQKTPVILSIGPYFNHSHQAATDIDPFRPNLPNSRFDDLINEGKIFEKGYTLVYVDLPGFGGSSGCNDFGGPNERLASKTAIEWAAAQDFSTGKVGMWGKSYDGWTQVMAMAENPEGLAATVIQAPIIDGYRTLYQNGVHYDQGWYVTPALYQAIDVLPPTVNEEPDYYLNWAQGENAACYAANIAQQTAFIEKDDPAGFWAARDVVEAAKEHSGDVAVLWSHGFLDANTKPDNFMDVFSGLKGPHKGFFGQFEHVRGNEDAFVGRAPGTFMAQAMAWFDEYLKGNAGAAADVPAVQVADGNGRWRAEQQWPPADAVTKAIPLKDGAYTDDDASSASSPEGAWSFTRPATAITRIAGVPKLTVTVDTASPRAQLAALLYDVDKDGNAKLITRGTAAVSSGEASFELYPQDWRLDAGDRLGVLIAGDDTEWYLGPHSLQEVSFTGGTLEIGQLTAPRTSFLTNSVKTRAMGTVPVATVDAATIEANTVDFGF
jgi:predicted acyl esterase